MTFSQIQKIMRMFMRQNPCPKCHKSFPAKNILIISMVDRHVLLLVHCCNCQFDTVADMTIYLNKKGMTIKSTVYIPPKQGITRDEVLDFRNHLKNFQGDFKKLFSESLM